MNSAQILAKAWYYAKAKRRIEVTRLIASAKVKRESFGLDGDERLHLKDGSTLLFRKLVNEYVC